MFNVTSLKEWGNRLRNSFRTEMPGSDAWLWPNTIGVIAKVVAMWAYQLELRIRWALRQAFVSTAEGAWLDRHAEQYGLSRKSATFGNGNVRFTGNYGDVIPIGTLLTRSDGITYTTDLSATVTAIGYVDVAVTATKTGPEGNSVSDTELAIGGGTPANVTASVGPLGIGQGTDAENDEALRSRVLFRLQYPPHGGSQTDYEQWALSQPGVTRAWARGNAFGPGTVALWFMMDDTYADGIPLQADVDAMAAYIDMEKPITAMVTVYAPTKEAVDITIANLTPQNETTQATVYDALIDMFERVAEPSLPGNLYMLRRSWIWQAVSNATGEEYHSVEAPGGDVSFGIGVIPCLGTVTFKE